MYIEGLLKPRHELGEALLADCIIEKKRKKRKNKRIQDLAEKISEGTVTFKLKNTKNEKLLQLPVVTPPPKTNLD